MSQVSDYGSSFSSSWHRVGRKEVYRNSSSSVTKEMSAGTQTSTSVSRETPWWSETISTCLFVTSEFSTRREWVSLEMLFCFLLEMRQHSGVYPAAGCVRSPTAVTVATRYSHTSLKHLLGFVWTISWSVWGLLSRGHFNLTLHLQNNSQGTHAEYASKVQECSDLGILPTKQNNSGQSKVNLKASLAGQDLLHWGGMNLVQENKEPFVIHLKGSQP